MDNLKCCFILIKIAINDVVGIWHITLHTCREISANKSRQLRVYKQKAPELEVICHVIQVLKYKEIHVIDSEQAHRNFETKYVMRPRQQYFTRHSLQGCWTGNIKWPQLQTNKVTCTPTRR